mmetsp:Transcript_7838/g.34904  ORF Transcript_7838/g.34904 Transcript_7838/m.34904 type:complete len:127 (-) Transcript_7838:1394-1774(-)
MEGTMMGFISPVLGLGAKGNSVAGRGKRGFGLSVNMTVAANTDSVASGSDKEEWASRNAMYGLSNEQKLKAMTLPDAENPFTAKYIAFDESDTTEYSLDKVVYRAQKGGLLDVRCSDLSLVTRKLF